MNLERIKEITLALQSESKKLDEYGPIVVDAILHIEKSLTESRVWINFSFKPEGYPGVDIMWKPKALGSEDWCLMIQFPICRGQMVDEKPFEDVGWEGWLNYGHLLEDFLIEFTQSIRALRLEYRNLESST